MNIETGTVLKDQYDGLCQVLKKISDGYLVLYYEHAHYVYNVLYKTLDEINAMCVCCEDWENHLFDSDNIAHIDEFGFCKKTD